ncbi:vacuolar alkaline phosphatase [Scheffersomyces stipitis CBS 6054]|uniref:Alkaline phosphatase n=1 Tax=Scheffersomyces stipitis (strain ATCC 58785 / CBS 6054 / NBRC 10063 / NRRL Y-11545) TaxID=322104 RepID=A3LRY4_PICST|nr:vacuolar alkaline phosphatase [Scheffersomyces stipitis CBS 6054]ABN65815.1 vacuolar alkaline phosphatase [Scheffersomyces stipitis CBS 6054]
MANFVFPKICNLSILALAVYLYLFDVTVAAPVDNSKETKKNIIFLISDGMGAASVQLARSFRQVRDDLPYNDLLELDNYLIGTFRTKSNSSYVTDSAAAGTALATGFKSYNKAINVDPEGKPVGSIGEALKLQGYAIGIVVTTKVTDATPSVWAAHAIDRSSEPLIAEQLLGDHPLGRIPDLILGGGRAQFVPATEEGGARKDSRNLIEEVQTNGTWSYVGDRESFDQLQGGDNVTLPLLGLFADKDFPYRIDREDSEYPSLVEETQVALKALSKATEDSEKGFFLLVEASRPDHAGHGNDAPSIAREVLEFDDVVTEVLKFVEESETETIVIATADHETGGLAVFGRSPKDYQAILNATHSSEFLVNAIDEFEQKDNDDEFRKFIQQTVIEQGLGLTNYTQEEVDILVNGARNEDQNLQVAIGNLTNSRSEVSWGSTDHTAVDVDIYSYSNSPILFQKILNTKDGLLGTHENTDFSVFIKSITGIDLEEVTDKIQNVTLA